MIKSINSIDGTITAIVSGQGGPYHSGAVFWDGSAQKMRVMNTDGVSQDMYGQDVHISGGPALMAVMSWAHKKMAEEADLDRICRAYPNLEDARREFDMLYRLVKEHK